MPWIAVDLDGTLAEYSGFKGPQVIGAPVPAMIERVKRWITEGKEVVIFTSRVSHPKDGEECRQAVEDWSQVHIGVRLPVTCIKDYRINEFWDDRAAIVEPNTGRIIAISSHFAHEHTIEAVAAPAEEAD